MAQNPYDMNIVKHLYAATGGSGVDLGQRQAILRQLVSSDQRLMAPATMLVMNEEANLRDKAMKQGGQPPVAMQKLGFAPPAPPAGLGAIGPQGGGMPAPQGPQMASAAPMGMPAPMDQPPVGMAAGGMTELPASVGGGLTTLPLPDDMYNEESFGGGGIVAFSKGGQKGETNKEAEAWEASVAMERKYGVPARLTFAQWKLESGSGKRMPPGSNNPFGVKATGKSPYVEANTTEFVGGKPVRTKEKFRKYDSLMDAFEGRTKMLATSPLYKDARESNYDPFILGKTYATDPKYGEKIATLMQDSPSTPIQLARKEPPAPTIYDLARSTLPGISSAAALPVRDARFDRPPIQYMTQPQMPRAPMPKFDVADAEVPVVRDARFEPPPIQYMAQPQMPRAQMPRFDVASAEVPTRATQLASGLGAAAAELNPISTARAAEAPKPKAQAQLPVPEWKDPVGKVPYVPMYIPLDPNKPMPSKAKRYADVASQFVGAGTANLLGALPLNATAETINRTANFFTKPIDPNEGVPAAPVTPKQYGEVDKYAGPGNLKGVRHYTMGEDPALEAALTGSAAAAATTPGAPGAPGAPGSAVSGVDARFKQLMDLVGQGPQLKGASAEELAAQRDQDVGMALLNAAAKGLSSKDPTLLGSLGAAAEGAMPALAESAKERKVRERELRQAEFDRDKTMFGVKGEAAKYALGIGESADENLYREYMSAPPERQRLIEKYLAAKSPYGNLSAQLGRDKFEAEQLKSHLDDIIRTPVSQLAPELGITNEAEKRAYIARGRQALLSAASTGGGGGFGAPPPGAVRQRNS